MAQPEIHCRFQGKGREKTHKGGGKSGVNNGSTDISIERRTHTQSDGGHRGGSLCPAVLIDSNQTQVWLEEELLQTEMIAPEQQRYRCLT